MGKEFSYLGKKYYSLPSNKCVEESKSLIIVMSTHNQKDRYFLFNKLLECTERSSDVIFVTDPNNSYYLDSDNGKEYFSFFEYLIKDYDPINVSLFGTSMSGYAALLFSRMIGCNAIVNNPQVNLNESYAFAWPALKNTLSNVCSLDISISDYEKKPGSCFVVYGEHAMDEMNKKLLDASSNLFDTYISRGILDKSHGFYFEIVEDIFEINSLILKFNDVKLIKVDKLKY